MPTLTFRGVPIELNEDGYLLHPELWDDDLAALLAREQEGIASLGPEHWAVIRCIRGFYEEHGLAPLVRLICKKTDLKLKTIYELFPSGPAKGACKVAGLPGPDGCI